MEKNKLYSNFDLEDTFKWSCVYKIEPNFDSNNKKIDLNI